jgi:pimeloyl-ACP methyl ester carboxylesterase
MLLLHGFPSASHQFRRLIDALRSRFRLVALDYPSFGHSDAPTSATVGGPFTYTFDSLADVVERFCERLDLRRFVLYVFDFGARLASDWPSDIQTGSPASSYRTATPTRTVSARSPAST